MARLSRGSWWFLGFLALVLGGVALALYTLDDRIRPFGSVDVEPGLAIEFEVTQGQSVRAVGEGLAERGVIRSALRFRIAAEEADLASDLQPGWFELETGMTNEDAIATLAAGPRREPGVRFTVQEGLSVTQTLARIADQLDHLTVEELRAVLDERREVGENFEGGLRLPTWVPEPGEADDDVIDPFEGLLFPETYEVAAGAPAVVVLQRMVDELARATDAIDGVTRATFEDRNLTRYDALIIASLIERETQVNAERTVVSGVIAGRLADGMRLEIDATALYASGRPADSVTDIDPTIDSPYNTYLIDGLPPTPISGFGRASLNAAYGPEETTWRFYVLDPACDGRHVFADTFEEHQVNVEAFRAAGRCAPTG